MVDREIMPEEMAAQTGVRPRREQLADIGIASFGKHWQTALGRALGPLHPSRICDRIADRTIRAWVSGEDHIPAWVEDALPEVVASAVVNTEIKLAVLKEIGRAMHSESNMAAKSNHALGGYDGNGMQQTGARNQHPTHFP
jgi:hypothetical protein